MIKRELNSLEIAQMVKEFYNSDPEHILSVHETAERGLDFCINRTIADYLTNDIKIYGLDSNGKLVAYFGEERSNGERWLTGFMILPEYRKDFKSKVWNTILDHFKGSFKVGLYSKNVPAIKFLENNGCKFISNDINVYGEGKIFMMECE